MISVFGSFILNRDPTIKQFGVGLSVAVLLASTMVLSLAPAMLTLFGRAVWAPTLAVEAAPHVDIEGEPEPPSPEPPAQPHRLGPAPGMPTPGTNGPVAGRTAGRGMPRTDPGPSRPPQRVRRQPPATAASAATARSTTDLTDLTVRRKVPLCERSMAGA
jgi:MMPL family protein